MKTIMLPDDPKRVSDEHAARMVGQGFASYCPKRLWKAGHPQGPAQVEASSRKSARHHKRIRRNSRPTGGVL